MQMKLAEAKKTYQRYFNRPPTKETTLCLAKLSYSLTREIPLISVVVGSDKIALYYKDELKAEFNGSDFNDVTDKLFNSSILLELLDKAENE